MNAILGYGTRAWAFVTRDFRENISYRLAFAMQFYGIFFSVTLFYFIAKVFGSANVPALERYGSRYFDFVLVGLAFMGFMTMGMGVFAGSIRQGQMTGTLEAMLVTPTSITTIITASSLWAFLRSALNIGVYLGFGALFGFDLSRANWPAALLVLALSVTAFSGLGIVSASFVLAFKKGNPAAAIFGALSSLLSGVFYPVDVLPTWLQSLSWLLPLTHGLEGLRQAVSLGKGVRDVAPQLAALLIFTAVIMPLAIVGFRVAVTHAKREGSLAQY